MDFLQPVMDGIGTFANSIVTNPTMLTVVAVLITCGIAALAFGVVRRFIKK